MDVRVFRVYRVVGSLNQQKSFLSLVAPFASQFQVLLVLYAANVTAVIIAIDYSLDVTKSKAIGHHNDLDCDEKNYKVQSSNLENMFFVNVD